MGHKQPGRTRNHRMAALWRHRRRSQRARRPCPCLRLPSSPPCRRPLRLARPRHLRLASFSPHAWQNHSSTDGRLLLDPLQEHSIWEQSIRQASGQHMATLLEGPRNRMATLAMQAHQLLCSYAPQFLREKARAGWQQDAENFSAWLATFEATCRTANLLSPARLPLELIPLLDAAPTAAPAPRFFSPDSTASSPSNAASSTPGENGRKPPPARPPAKSAITAPPTPSPSWPPAPSGANRNSPPIQAPTCL